MRRAGCMHHHMQITVLSVTLLPAHSYITYLGRRRCHMADSGWESGWHRDERYYLAIACIELKCCFLCREHLSDDHYQTLVLLYTEQIIITWAMYEIAKKIILIIITIMYADRKDNTGRCNSAKIKNYCRLRFTSNGRERVRVSIVL